MRVIVATANDGSYDFRIDVRELDYRADSGNFSMTRPIGDDWLQRINHVPEPNPILVRVQDQTMFVIFGSLRSAKNFADWISNAEAEVTKGYRTMRG